MIKLLLEIFIWFVQLVYLVLIAAVRTIAQLFFVLFSMTQNKLNGNVERGKTFVRAYHYLEALENHGDQPETANSLASSLFEAWSDPDADHKIIIKATEYAKLHHGGNQLPIVKEARAKGFTG